jgi:CPA1 family monovalent cation:H+ antiporter
MGLFELVIALLLVGAVLALWADRIGVPYPTLLAIGGAALALIPGTPPVMLDPQLALALFVAPVLLDAAFDASPRDLKRHLPLVTSLAVLAVGLTVVAVAVVAKKIVPGMSWPVAVTLGAIVAPPDASAAIAVLRRLQPPHRLVVILEGESLFNDATALLIYRLAVGAAMGEVVHTWAVAPLLLLTCGGGLILGHVLARLYLHVTARVDDIPINVVLQFIGTFAVWLLADRIGVSAILTVIAYAMTLARRIPGRPGAARRRISSYAVWDVVVFVMNVLAFVLIGLQLKVILTDRHDADWKTYLVCALAVCLTVVIARFAWVIIYNTVRGWRLRAMGPGQRLPMTLPSLGGKLVIAWCGMRGIVTLAAALALPEGPGASGFPYRDLIVFCAFSVVLTTLVLQGMTLKPLIQWLGLRDDGAVEREIQLARAETARAALRTLEAEQALPAIETLRREYEARLRLGEELEHSAESPVLRSGSSLGELQRRAVAAQRQTLVALRAASVIGDDAFHAAEEEIDLIELTADERIRPEF